MRVFYYKMVMENKVIYVGSAKNFWERKRLHKLACDKGDMKLIYQTIRNKGGWEKMEFCFVECAYCVDREHSLAREQYWLELNRTPHLCNMRNAYAKGVAI
jgi:hypothetical protein